MGRGGVGVWGAGRESGVFVLTPGKPGGFGGHTSFLFCGAGDLAVLQRNTGLANLSLFIYLSDARSRYQA